MTMTADDLLLKAVQLSPHKKSLRKWYKKSYEKHWPMVKEAWSKIEGQKGKDKITSKKSVIRALIELFPADFPIKEGSTTEMNLTNAYRAFLHHEEMMKKR